MPEPILSAACLRDADAVTLGDAAAENQVGRCSTYVAWFMNRAAGFIIYCNQVASTWRAGGRSSASTSGASAGGCTRPTASLCRTTNARWRSP